MDIKKELIKKIKDSIKIYFKKENIINFEIEPEIEIPKNIEYGHFSTNISMKISKKIRKDPKEIAEKIVKYLDQGKLIKEVSVAYPGFINFKINNSVIKDIINEIKNKKNDYGNNNIGKGKSVLVEFISANPTGPLHIGHARGAVVGDIISRLLIANGYSVNKEYYFNDAGVQMQILGQTLKLRVQELLGEKINFPKPKINAETGEKHLQYYSGNYMIDIAKLMIKDKKINTLSESKKDIDVYINFAVKEILKVIDTDLESFGIKFDTWFNETTLHTNGDVKNTLNKLIDLNMTYENEGALWIKTKKYGDDKDRVIVKRDGNYTYLMPDIAYHKNKYDRSFDKLINVFGGDHHGYIKRLKSSISGLGYNEKNLDIVIVQMVSLLKNDKKIKLSTRSGEFITIKEMIQELGVDVVRYFFAMYSTDSQMIFDWELAKKTSIENPVHYVQYAYARCCSIFRKAEESKYNYSIFDNNTDLSLLKKSEEVSIILLLDEFPEIINKSVEKLSPHILTNYIYSVANIFHNYFTKGNKDKNFRIIQEDIEITKARLSLVFCVKTTIFNALNLLGIKPIENI